VVAQLAASQEGLSSMSERVLVWLFGALLAEFRVELWLLPLTLDMFFKTGKVVYFYRI
jgi:hypothetical protein